MIKGLVMPANATGGKTEKKKKKKKNTPKRKIIKKGAKTRQSISTRTKNKNAFKVKPWEQRGP